MRLVPPRTSDETIAELRELLARAECGELVGLAFVAIQTSSYTVQAVGQARHAPVVTRGMVTDLWDLLKDLQFERRR